VSSAGAKSDQSENASSPHGAAEIYFRALRKEIIELGTYTELDRIIDGDRFPFSPRIQTLKKIRAMIRPEPARGTVGSREYTRRRERKGADGAGDSNARRPHTNKVVITAVQKMIPSAVSACSLRVGTA
jgi:hypothetical protein